MRKLILLAAVWCIQGRPCSAGDLSAMPMEAVLEEIMAHPQFHQLCDGADLQKHAVPLPIYGRFMGREVGLTRQQTDVLRSRYAELVPVLKSVLGKLHPERSAATEREPGDDRTLHVTQFSSIYLFIVSDCHVIEALPELLTLEERLRTAIQSAEEHGKSPLPDVAWDGWIFPDRTEKLTQRAKFLEFCRVDQRELLSLMMRLLREQRFQPLLASEFEAQFQAAAAKAGHAQLLSNPVAESALADELSVSVPFSREARNEVRRLAQEFLATVPPAEWKHPSP